MRLIFIAIWVALGPNSAIAASRDVQNFVKSLHQHERRLGLAMTENPRRLYDVAKRETIELSKLLGASEKVKSAPSCAMAAQALYNVALSFRQARPGSDGGAGQNADQFFQQIELCERATGITQPRQFLP